MKHFLLKTILFFIPILLLSYPLDIFISNNLKKSTSFANKEYEIWNDILDGKINSKIVIYGSSRAWVHVSPKIIMDSLKFSTYNLGIDGHNFKLQNLRHNLLLKHNPKPKLILHCVDIFTLQKREDLYNDVQFLPYILLSKDFYEALKGYEGFGYFDFHLPLLRYTGKSDALMEFLKTMRVSKNKLKSLRIRGYQGMEAKWNNDLEKAKKKNKNYYVKFDKNTIESFNNYLSKLNKTNIRIVLVYPPEYIDGQNYVQNRKEVIDTFQYFSKKYNVPFYDFSFDSLSYQKKYFYNASHLNKDGSEIFTKKLLSLIKNNLK
jgi:hypothetical protein